VLPNTWFSIELSVKTPVPEWGGRELFVGQEEDAAMDGSRPDLLGVEAADGVSSGEVYDEQTLRQQIDKKVDFETFFAQAPRINPNVSKITGVICGYRVEEIEDKLMQQIRYLDKLIDELAKGKAMDKILRK
jgi:hypothetical protein